MGDLDRSAGPREPLLRARGLGFARSGAVVLAGLDFEVRPGLTFVRGGEGRGKTTLLRLMTGALEPGSGTLDRAAGEGYASDASLSADDETVARDWLDAERARCAAWDAPLADRLLEGFALGEHLGKRLFMLSNGTRRKLGLVAAFAGDASVATLDTPFAALDGPSSALLAALLLEAAAHPSRAWVIADHELPRALQTARLAGTIDLGD